LIANGGRKGTADLGFFAAFRSLISSSSRRNRVRLRRRACPPFFSATQNNGNNVQNNYGNTSNDLFSPGSLSLGRRRVLCICSGGSFSSSMHP
jgi:hypothetical protein